MANFRIYGCQKYSNQIRFNNSYVQLTGYINLIDYNWRPSKKVIKLRNHKYKSCLGFWIIAALIIFRSCYPKVRNNYYISQILDVSENFLK